jgi:hypothetical protein
MRFVLGLLAGLLGACAGWFGTALAVIGLFGPDRDGGIAMGAVFGIGPIGGLLGFVAAVAAFARWGSVREAPLAVDRSDAPRRRTSRRTAIGIVALAGGLSWWVWYDTIRSPYLSHGFMSLDLRFRAAAGGAPSLEPGAVRVEVEEGDVRAPVSSPRRLDAEDGRPVIGVTATLSRKTGRRIVHLWLADGSEAQWRPDLDADPEPDPEPTPWRPPTAAGAPAVEASFRLTADR